MPSPMPAPQDEVVVFLHDVNRRLEKRIMEELLTSTDGSIVPLGILNGTMGELAGFRVRGPSTA